MSQLSPGDLELHRAALTGHCYRMLGAAAEAEDAPQETLVRAWRAIGTFEGRSALKTWLYRIGTNVCLDLLEQGARRVRPYELGGPSSVANPDLMLLTALKVRYFGLMLGAVRGALAANDTDAVEVVLRRALAALVGVKRENLRLTQALRGPMADTEGLGFVRETLHHFVALLSPHLARALPGLEGVERRAQLLVAALEGAISHAVHAAPAWLAEDWFVDDLVALSVGYLRAVHPPRALAR